MSDKRDIIERLYITPHFITADEFGFPYTMPHEITQRNKEERYEAAREINRLRKERDDARMEISQAERNAEITYENHKRIVAELTAERDEARRELCFEQSMVTNLTIEQIAETRGWDCFKKDTQ